MTAALFQGGAAGGAHWIQYAFPHSETLSEAAVYWAGGGNQPARGGAQAPPAAAPEMILIAVPPDFDQALIAGFGPT